MKIDISLYDRVSELTNTEYKGIFAKEPDEPVLVFSDDIESMLENLILEIDRLNEKIEDREKDIEENYERKSVASQVGVTDKDFIYE